MLDSPSSTHQKSIPLPATHDNRINAKLENGTVSGHVEIPPPSPLSSDSPSKSNTSGESLFSNMFADMSLSDVHADPARMWSLVTNQCEFGNRVASMLLGRQVMT
jgi:hypothetical protein